MVDVITVSSALPIGGQENINQQRSTGKRTRESIQANVGSNSKRRALASLSNHVDAIAERQRQNSKVPQTVNNSET